MRSTAEPGRDKILFKECQGTCNLIGRDFPEEEHLLSSKDISSVIIIITIQIFKFFYRFNHKFLLVGIYTLIGFYFTAPEVTASLSQLCTTN